MKAKTVKAKTVLEQYKQGKRKFRNINLKGQSFKEKNLSGIDFSGAQLQGTDFSKTKLQGAIFSKAKLQGTKFIGAELQGTNFIEAEAGLGPLWKIIGGIGLFGLSLIFEAVIPFISFFLMFSYLDYFFVSEHSVFLLFVSAVLLLGFSIINLVEGIEAALWVASIATTAMLLAVIPQPVLIIIAWVLFVVVFLATTVVLPKVLPLNLPLLILLSSILLISGVFISFKAGIYLYYSHEIQIFSAAVCFSLLAVIGVAVTFAKSGMIIGWHNRVYKVMAILIAMIIPCSLLTIGTILAWQGSFDLSVILILYFLSIGLGVYIGWCALDDDPRYVLIRNISLNLGVFGNTIFQDADLSNANFTKATIQLTDLRGAILTHTDWYQAKRLAHARVGRSYLQSPQVRKLVLGKSGEKKKFDQLDLSGIKLPKARLTGASFIRTNLTEANLQEADLSNANLVETDLEKVNLDGATLTGACVENWRITKNTNLNGVNCDYLYLRQSNRLREPENKGEKLDFKELSQKFIDAEEKLKSLHRTFEQLYPISDKVALEYSLIEEARNANISRASYRKMFEDYRRQKIENEWQKTAWKSIFARLEHVIEQLNQLVSEMDIFSLLERLSQLSIVIAVILFINQILKEKTELQYRGWEIINSESSNVHGGTVIVLKNWKKHGGSLHGIKAQKANLSNIKLSKADLSGADFSGANLKNADLRSATLKDAKFNNANLSGANFKYGAAGFLDFLRPEKTKQQGANLSGADFSGANLKNADFSGADLSGAKNLSQAKNLKDANLKGANLSEADLSVAYLQDPDLRDADLSGADFSGADFSGADLSGDKNLGQAKNLKGANLSEANLSVAYLQEANLSGADLQDADLSGAYLKGANLSGAKNLSQAKNLKDADLSEANLSEANLSVANLQEANLSEANLSGADLSGADLSGADLSGADLQDIIWNERTDWSNVQGLDSAINVPENWKQQLLQ